MSGFTRWQITSYGRSTAGNSDNAGRGVLDERAMAA
jgi:hypothetical protein